MQRILVVEDEDDSREALRTLLEASGYEVETADNGIDGLAKLKAVKPHTAILDIDLPGMTGYDIARGARSVPELRSVTLIALTGFGAEKDRQTAREAGFDQHLTKPVSFATLRAVIERHSAARS